MFGGKSFKTFSIIGLYDNFNLQDVNFTTFLADQLLQMYCDNGSFSAEDLLDHLGSCMVVSDR